MALVVFTESLNPGLLTKFSFPLMSYTESQD